jgi:hypothetical protein
MNTSHILLQTRVKLATRVSKNRVTESIDTLHCAGCNQRTTIKAAAHMFAKVKAPTAARNLAQSMKDFAWGTRGQSGCYDVALVAPQNVKMAKMMNGASISCERCGIAHWNAGVSSN